MFNLLEPLNQRAEKLRRDGFRLEYDSDISKSIFVLRASNSRTRQSFSLFFSSLSSMLRWLQGEDVKPRRIIRSFLRRETAEIKSKESGFGYFGRLLDLE